jgi:LAO/AO transport system kinase
LAKISLPPEWQNEDGKERWQVPITQTVAISGEGVPDLAHALHDHRAYLERSGEGLRRARMRVVAEMDALLREALLDRLLAQVDSTRLGALIERVWARDLEPHAAVNSLMLQEGLSPCE